ncbi:hypothetical protein [Streptomyces silvensis]|uniref:Uncharacterized protein n=1 Tax=Streptomyces silvensis TaxID=1765722 RepID=A0A0W7X7S9_9ACTN|nr:hypothetical protein [Streptomyces silvensis]KUF18833.1 hypothetical protein AT728_07305 [Streptomyces silvensis]
MATNGELNDLEQWRSIVEYQQRKPNPARTWENRYEVPAYLDEWDDEVRTDTRGPYQTAENARRQASRDAKAREARGWGWMQPGERIPTERVLRVAIERTTLAWEEVDVRDPETGKWGS